MTAGRVLQLLAEISGAEAARAVFAILEDCVPVLSAFETAPEAWRIEAYPAVRLLTPEMAARLSLVAAAAGGAVVDLTEESLPARDWLAENRLAFPPVRIGRFFIYGSHYHGRVPADAIGIAVDAAAAFGTGEHPSTRGCLLALDALARRRRFRRPLDIGTGTGILAIAAAKSLRRPVLARDLDAAALRIASYNVARNRVATLVRLGQAAGYRGRALRGRRHDLVFANILARPLALMAVHLARRLAPGGRAVLSGLLRPQEPIVLAPHRGCGVVLERRLTIDGWSTLIMRRRAARQAGLDAANTASARALAAGISACRGPLAR